MREINADDISRAVCESILKAQYEMDPGIVGRIENSIKTERSALGREVLSQLLENYFIASSERIPVCQDTGMCVIFARVGQEVHINGAFEDALNSGVATAYAGLRKSIVDDPLYDRFNTRDNTPAVIHAHIVPGDEFRLRIICKGFGSENMSRIKMLTPSQGEQGVIDFALETALLAGANPCPPIILGMCVGGDFEQAALMAKLMTSMGMDYRHPDPRYQALEDKISQKINTLGIGPAGFGGDTSLIKLNICSLPTHIAGMPCAMNVCCHASRHAEFSL